MAINCHLLEECICELLDSGLRADFRRGLRELSRTFDVRILPIFTCNAVYDHLHLQHDHSREAPPRKGAVQILA